MVYIPRLKFFTYIQENIYVLYTYTLKQEKEKIHVCIFYGTHFYLAFSFLHRMYTVDILCVSVFRSKLSYNGHIAFE